MIRTDGTPTIAWYREPEDPAQVMRRLESHPIVRRYLRASADQEAAQLSRREASADPIGASTAGTKED